MDKSRNDLMNAFEQLSAYCCIWQESLYSDDTFDSPEAMKNFHDEVYDRLEGESSMIMYYLRKYLNTLDSKTIY